MARGHVRQRGEKWVAIVELPPDVVTGKRQQRWVTCGSRKEADRTVTKLLRELDTTGVAPTGTTLNDFLTRYVDTVTALHAEPNTLRTYRSRIRNHIAPRIGHITLDKLTPAHLAGMYAAMAAAGASSRTIRHCHAILHVALQQALLWGEVYRNVVDMVKGPTVRQKRWAVWTNAQAVTFLNAIEADRLVALYHVAIATGMRQGELLGLKWADVDWLRGSLEVQRSITRDGTVQREKDTKTEAGRRLIAVGPETLTILRAHKTRQDGERDAAGKAWAEKDLIFCRLDGGYYSDTTLRWQWRKTVKRLGLPTMRFHDLRHFHATLLLRAGVHPAIVAQRLGHASVAVTMNVYSHVTPDMQSAAVDAVSAALAK